MLTEMKKWLGLKFDAVRHGRTSLASGQILMPELLIH
jgi:hypothetical protein